MASIGTIIAEASEYVKTGCITDWKRWLILIILMIVQGFTLCIVPLFNGYLVRVYGSSNPTAPGTEGIGRLFVDGWKFNIITILYLIPAIIVALIFGVLGVLPMIAGILSTGKIAEIVGIAIGSLGILLAVLLVIVFSLLMYMAYVRFSRSGALADAFAIGDISHHISSGIGWGPYVAVWIIVWILSATLFLIIMGLSVVPFLGPLAGLILSPLWGVFIARIISNVYDATA